MVSTQPNADGSVEESPVPPHHPSRKISLVIPVYYANEELRKMTERCVASIGEVDELILQVDPTGEGYSKTTNKALQKAMGDILVIGNNDLIFPENWLSGLLKVLEEGFDIATCWTSDQDYKLDSVIKEGGLIGSIFAMTKQVYDTIGGFDEQFKGYFSDRDFQKRAEDAGFRVGMNHNLVIHHEAKATYKQTDPNDDEFIKAGRLFEAKHGFLP